MCRSVLSACSHLGVCVLFVLWQCVMLFVGVLIVSVFSLSCIHLIVMIVYHEVALVQALPLMFLV